MVKQFYKEYYYWEDYKNGMYQSQNKLSESENVDLACKMLSDSIIFFETCKQVILNWPISTKVNLTNISCNRRAWLGQACCSYKFNVPEIHTRLAWGTLSEKKKYEANQVAERIIIHFEREYERNDNQLCLFLGV